MTPEQKQDYKRTRLCPSCGGNNLATGDRTEAWEPHELPEESSLYISKECQDCETAWVERHDYVLADVFLNNDEEDE